MREVLRCVCGAVCVGVSVQSRVPSYLQDLVAAWCECGRCYGLGCVLLNSYVEALTLVPQNVTVVGNSVFKEVITLK